MGDIPATSNDSIGESSRSAERKFRPLRVWPAVLLLAAMLGARLLPGLFEGNSMILMMVAAMGPLLLGGLIMIWWLAFSRATVSERVIGFFGTIAVAAAAFALSDKSMRGPGTMIMAVPFGTGAFALGAIFFRQTLALKRTVAAILLAACGFGVTALMRSDGMWGNAELQWYWRWESSDEERMLADRGSRSAEAAPAVTANEFDAWLGDPQWPRFRGANGLSQQHGARVAADWSVDPPEQIWKIPVGPGWSSFSVAGNALFTQEQRGENEAVVCYAADSGQEIWVRQLESRFEEAMGGPGPRATPTLARGGLFAQGASGQLQRLDPRTGDVVWLRDLREEAEREPPTWGFSSSPLVVGEVVIVHAGGQGDKGTLAFNLETGKLVWSAAAGDHSYSSPQLCTVSGREYVVMLTNAGVNLLDPESGEQQLGYEWEHYGYRALQPQVVDGSSILLPTGPGTGTRLIQLTETDGALRAEELWTSTYLKPDFNDFVVFEGHAYGFDGAIFTCIDLATGNRKWKGGRYGTGQVLLLADSGYLLVASEYGEAVLLQADPTRRQELSRFTALEGKTWNHPVVIGDRLYMRNSREAACYRLPLAASMKE